MCVGCSLRNGEREGQEGKGSRGNSTKSLSKKPSDQTIIFAIVSPESQYSCLSSSTGTSSCSMEISTLSIQLTSQSSSCTKAQNRTLSKQLMTHQIQDLHSRAPLTQAVYRYRLCFGGVEDFPLHGNCCSVRL